MDGSIYGLALNGAVSAGSVIVSSAVAWNVARLSAKQALATERTRRQGDLALKISEMVSTEPETARRFAIAVMKIIDGPIDVGMVFFVPVNSRITVGRDPENDIALTDDDTLSRFQCGFVSEEDEVCVEDYVSTNGTFVNAKRINVQSLADGDRIVMGRYEFLFKKVHRNRMLLP